MSAPPRTDHEHDPANEPPTGSDIYGWGDRSGRGPRTAAGTGTDGRRTGTAPWRRRSAAPERNGAAGAPERNAEPAPGRNGTLPDRNDSGWAERNADAGEPGDRSDAGVPMHHEIAVPDADGTGSLVMTSRAGELAQQAADDLRFVNLPLGSLRQVLWTARRGDFNLAHIPAIRSANIAFFYLVTAPTLIVARLHEWVHVRLHRAITTWAIVLVCAHFLNRLLGWPVLAWFDPWAWSATAWQVAAAAAFVFVLATVVVYLRGRE